MIIINNTVLIGRLTREPELRFIAGKGTAVCKFTIAVDKGLSKETKQELEGKGQPTEDFINIITWGKTAEAVANFTDKGKLIAVNGKIETGSYEDKDGKRVYTTDINAFNVEFLEYKDRDTNNVATDWGTEENKDIPF